MSGGPACSCGEHKKPVEERPWVILQYRCNHSAFNGYHHTPSEHSTVECRACGRIWRTKAGYVNQLERV